MKKFLYRHGWPWFFRFSRKVFNRDISKTIHPDNSVTYQWEKWT